MSSLDHNAASTAELICSFWERPDQRTRLVGAFLEQAFERAALLARTRR